MFGAASRAECGLDVLRMLVTDGAPYCAAQACPSASSQLAVLVAVDDRCQLVGEHVV